MKIDYLLTESILDFERMNPFNSTHFLLSQLILWMSQEWLAFDKRVLTPSKLCRQLLDRISYTLKLQFFKCFQEFLPSSFNKLR